LREFLEGKTRNLGNDVINGRLEARRGFARDVVLDFVEQVADDLLENEAPLTWNYQSFIE
jgi:hypothetical protein